MWFSPGVSIFEVCRYESKKLEVVEHNGYFSASDDQDDEDQKEESKNVVKPIQLDWGEDEEKLNESV